MAKTIIKGKGCKYRFIPPFNIDKYKDSNINPNPYDDDTPEFTNVLVDSNGHVLYGKYADGTSYDATSIIGDIEVESGVTYAKIINSYKNSLNS